MAEKIQNIFEGNKREPHLRIAVTPKCNFKCTYCKPGGEGVCENGEKMTVEEIVKIIDIASDIGFKHIKFTGGEPLMKKDIFHILRGTDELKKLKEIQLVTNGSLLTYEKAKKLEDSGINSLTISLDASNRKAFERITRVDCFDKVIQGIYNARKVGLPVTINSVLMKSNYKELEGIIEIARKTGSRLKLIDYMDLGDHEKWKKEYLSFEELRKKLDKKSSEFKWIFPPGGLGTPMPCYRLEGRVEILLRDATVGTNYCEKCEKCKNYPCQDALISLRVTHDGNLKRCLIRDDNLVDVLTPLREGNLETVNGLIKESYDILTKSEYLPNAWKPNNCKEGR